MTDDIDQAPEHRNSPSEQRPSKWRSRYPVHPVADLFPLTDGAELEALAEDIKKNGLKDRITFQYNGVDRDILVDGRRRMTAMERAGIKLLAEHKQHLNHDADAVAFIVSKNLHRRHLSKEQQADLLVAIANIAPENKPGQDGPVSSDGRGEAVTACARPASLRIPKAPAVNKGGRGKRNPVKARALELNKTLPKKDQVSERTIKRSLRKATGETPKYTARPLPKPRSGKPVLGLEAARRHYLDQCADPGVDLDAELTIIVEALKEIAGRRLTARQAKAEAL
jgi:hypothetical protein